MKLPEGCQSRNFLGFLFLSGNKNNDGTDGIAVSDTDSLLFFPFRTKMYCWIPTSAKIDASLWYVHSDKRAGPTFFRIDGRPKTKFLHAIPGRCKFVPQCHYQDPPHCLAWSYWLYFFLVPSITNISDGSFVVTTIFYKQSFPWTSGHNWPKRQTKQALLKQEKDETGIFVFGWQAINSVQ